MDQRMYAFWTHAIDLIFLNVERKYSEEISKDAYVPDDYCGDEDYVDAAHKGLLLEIRSLPHEVRTPVVNYLKQRLELSITNMPDDVSPDNFINWLITENVVEYVRRHHV